MLKIMQDNTVHLSKEPYGVELAKKVVEKIRTFPMMCSSHKEYCGIGLLYYNGTYYIGRVYDGWVDIREPVLYKTKSEKALIKLLAKQSDATMSGTIPGSVLYETNDFFQNNQRITKALLEEFVKRDI